jgi:hypothetical protein
MKHRLSRYTHYFIPNIGTLVLMALLLFAYRASAAPAPDPVAPPPPSQPQTTPTAPDVMPGTISYQCMLTDAAGRPVNGKTDIVFRLYDAPTGGTKLWEEAHLGVSNGVPVANGLCHVLLGSLTPIPAGVWSNANVYLGVQVGSDTEMSPREIVGPVGAALSVIGEQPYYFTGAFATPTEWMADVIFNGNYARFCQAIGKTYSRAEELQAHYTDPIWDSTFSGRGNGYFYPGWYYVGSRFALTDTHTYGNGNVGDPYNVWKYNGGNGCCMARNSWTFERSAIIWCK